MPNEVSRPRTTPEKLPDEVWAPLIVGLLILIPGVLSLAVDLPLLFPSLGPIVYLQAAQPQLKSASFYNTVVGHLIGLGFGVLSVWLFGVSADVSTLTEGRLGPERLFAGTLALSLTLLAQILLNANHPPAASTTLLIALGGFGLDWQPVGWIAVGVLIVAITGEGARRLRPVARSAAKPGHRD